MRCSFFLPCLIAILVFASCDSAEPIELAEPRPVDPKLIILDRQIALQLGESSSIPTVYITDDSRTENPSVSWSVADESIAELSSSGELTAKAAGQTFVTATFERSTSYPSLITVVENPTDLARIDLVPDTVETEQRKQYTLDFTAWTLEGNRIDNPTATWSITDPSIGSINQAGQLESLARGVSEVEIAIDGIKSLPLALSVFGEKKTGQFSGLGDYSASGQVTLVQLPEGGNELQFSESFFVDAGPRLDVYISKTNRVNGDSIKLGLLSAFRGEQRFFVPENTNFDDVAFVIIHCTTYDLPFGRATMR